MGTKWEPVESGKELTYLKIDREPAFVTQPYKDRIQFWNSLSLNEFKE
jgi:hypothetical protein